MPRPAKQKSGERKSEAEDERVRIKEAKKIKSA
jgi:hypothetical protein